MKTMRNMVDKWFKIRILAIFLLSITISGCVKENLEYCEIDQVIRLKVVDVNGQDITEDGVVTKADLYLFDYNNMYVKKVTLTEEQIVHRAPITIPTNMKVAVWGNLYSRETVSQMEHGIMMENANLKLITDNNGYTKTPDHLFFGTKDLIASGSKTNEIANEIVISPKVARMHITVRGLLEGTSAGDYFFKVNQKYDGYNFLGIPTSKNIDIREFGQFTMNNDLVSPASFNLLHSVEGEQDAVSVRVFGAEGVELAVADKDVNNKPITPKAGETVNVLIDLSKAELEVHVEVTPWDEIYQWVEW